MDTESKKTTTTSTTAPKKTNKTLIIVIIIVLGLCLCAAAIAAGAYYFSMKAATDLANQVKTTTDSTNNIGTNPDANNDSTDTDNTNGESTNLQIGKLPSNFPNDVPVYTGAEITGSSSTSTETDVLLSAKATAADIYSFYKSALPGQGWTITEDTNSSNVYGLKAEKGTRKLEVGIIDNSSETETASVLTLSLK